MSARCGRRLMARRLRKSEVSTGSGSDRVTRLNFRTIANQIEYCDPVATAPGTDLILAGPDQLLSAIIALTFLNAMCNRHDLHFRPLASRANLFAD
jgi:hypothetical protein